MRWTVETLNETVDAELAALPADMRARLTRIAELIEAVGLPSVKEPHEAHPRTDLGDSPQGQGRHRPSAIHHRKRAARCDPASFREEDREDTRR
jgi:hypothetical protein